MVTAAGVLAAPAGVVLLGRLEARHSPGTWLREVPEGTSAASVVAAATGAREMPLGELLDLAVQAGFDGAGPWSSSSNRELVRAYLDAPARAAIAEAVADRFSATGDCDLDRQEWWHTNHAAEGWFAQRRLERHDELIYDTGQFTHAGIWTATAPPPATHDALASAWELDDQPISRWRLPIRADARVFTVDTPGDWVALVAAYPVIPTRRNSGWELPGMNDHIRDPRLADVSSGHAARNEIDHLVMPHWSRVARDYDGVHLTWGGWLTSEGFASDTPDSGVTMLRFWFSERTLWLNDVFGEPEPLETSDAERRDRDREVLRAMLGR